MREKLLFLRSALRHPQIVSWVSPTSAEAARRIANEAADSRRPQTVVELGAGSGAVTRALLAALHPESRLVVIELLPELAAYLRATVTDARCSVAEGDARQLARMLAERGIGPVDAVVSGIPFSQIGAAAGADIARQLGKMVAPGGVVVAYQVRRNVCEVLAPQFPRQSARWLPWNLPPLRLVTARRA